MAREPVAMDFMGLGLGESRSEHNVGSERGTLVKPIPTVPEKQGMGSVSRSSNTSDIERAADRENSIRTLRQGMHRASWKKKTLTQQPLRYHVDGRSEDENVGKRDVSPKIESADFPPLTPSPSLSIWEDSSSGSPSQSLASTSPTEFQQQVCMRAAAMYAGLQARNVQNTSSHTSSHGDEQSRGAQPSERAGPESPLSLSIPATEHCPPAVSPGGFGSPLPVHQTMKGNCEPDNGGPFAGKGLSQMQHLMQGGNVKGHTLSRPAQSGGMGKQPRTAQLTIFYAGMVNVFDDVPFDKAQAIMLLAGSGNTWSSNCINLPANGVTPRPFSAPTIVSQSSPYLPASSASQVNTTMAAGPTAPMLPKLIANALRQPVTRNVHVTYGADKFGLCLVAELPQARKASLARFLEKRKDRVRAKAPYPVKREKSATPPRDQSPSPNNKPSTRSPSPTPVSEIQCQQVPSPGHQQFSSGSEPTSPTRPSQTPPRQSLSDKKSTGTPGGGDYEEEREVHRGRSSLSCCEIEAGGEVLENGVS